MWSVGLFLWNVRQFLWNVGLRSPMFHLPYFEYVQMCLCVCEGFAALCSIYRTSSMYRCVCVCVRASQPYVPSTKTECLPGAQEKGGLISIGPYIPPKSPIFCAKSLTFCQKRMSTRGAREGRADLYRALYPTKKKALYSVRRALRSAKRECLPVVRVKGGLISRKA